MIVSTFMDCDRGISCREEEPCLDWTRSRSRLNLKTHRSRQRTIHATSMPPAFVFSSPLPKRAGGAPCPCQQLRVTHLVYGRQTNFVLVPPSTLSVLSAFEAIHISSSEVQL